MKGYPLVQSEKFQKKSLEKNLEKHLDSQRGILCVIEFLDVGFVYFGEVLRFRVFRTSVVEVVEQMNKVDLTRLKNYTL